MYKCRCSIMFQISVLFILLTIQYSLKFIIIPYLYVCLYIHIHNTIYKSVLSTYICIMSFWQNAMFYVEFG